MDKKEIDKTLESKNIKPTAMRELVYKVLLESGKAMSLSDLEQAFEKVERSTIYRALKTFEDNFIVHSVDDGTGSIKYALCNDDCKCTLSDSHVHFLCRRCDRTRCMKNIPIPDVILPEGFTYESVQLIITGVCPVCD